MNMTWREAAARSFLWISVLAWGILLGAKLFDLIVLAGAWSASPPESLRLLPYGKNYPVDTGVFFIPSSAALLFCTFGALVAGWKTPLRYRALLAISALSIFGTLVFTVLVFWPMNGALWAYASSSPRSTLSGAEVTAMARRWVALDWCRVAVGTLGFLSATAALSRPYPGVTAERDPLIVNIAFGVLVVSVVAFLIYFVSHV
jgi:hypothetical protein